MKTLTGIDLFVQALLIFTLLGTGAAAGMDKNYIIYYLLSLLATGIWQLGSAVVGSFYNQDKYKSIYLAASIIFCSILVFLSGANHFPFSEQYTRVALLTFLGIIPVFASMIYFYICVDAYDRRMKAKKDAEFV